MYKGVVIKESLANPDILSGFKVLRTETTDDSEWHIYWVEADERGLESIKDNIADNRWYAHFADGGLGIVVFKDKIFRMDTKDKNTWAEAVEYGKSIGIPSEQMDFEFGELA